MPTLKYYCPLHNITQAVLIDPYANEKVIKEAEKKVSHCLECSKERYLKFIENDLWESTKN